MLITLTKTEQVQQEVDIEFPSYYKDVNGIEHWMVCSEKKAIQVYLFSESNCFTTYKNMKAEKLYEIITRFSKMSQEEFKSVLMSVVESAECYSTEIV